MEVKVPMPQRGHSLKLLAVSVAKKTWQSAGCGSRSAHRTASRRRHRSSFSARWQLARKP